MGIYSPLVTKAGLAAIATARAIGHEIIYSEVAVGDANGTSYTPLPSQTALVNEKWRGDIESVYVHPNNPSWVVAECRIPITIGGFEIREAAVFSADGIMIALARYPHTVKPAPGTGTEKDLLVRFVFEVSNAAEITHIIEPSLMYATKEYVQAHIHHVRVATTENTALLGLGTVDGVAVIAGERVLVKAQTDATKNGIYIVKPGSWERALDFNTPENVLPTALITVAEGTIHKDSLFMLMADNIVLDATALNFVEFGKKNHTHDDRYFTENEVNTLLAAKAALSHTHTIGNITSLQSALDGKAATSHSHDDRYFTETEVNNLLAGKAASSHTHDERYFTETEVNTLLAAKAALSHTHTIANITSLQSALDGKAATSHSHDDRYFTETEVNNLLAGKAASSHTHDDRYFTETEVNTLLAAKAALSHTHTAAQVGAAATSHNHSALNITSGTLPVARGGTNLSSYTSGRYLRTSSTSALAQYTPAQVLADIGATAITDFANSKSANGYQKLPNGLIIQWGKHVPIMTSNPVPQATFDAQKKSFPIAFPNAALSVVVASVSGINERTLSNDDALGVMFNETHLLMLARKETIMMNYIAIGY